MQAFKKGFLNKKDFARNRRGILTVTAKGIDLRKRNDDENEIKKSNKSVDDAIFDEESVETAESKYLDRKANEYKQRDLGEYADYNFKILYEDDRVMIIDKPAGLMVHPDDRNDEVTISDIAYAKYPSVRGVGEGDRWGVVHRLDRNTTGALVLCKSNDSYKDMKNLFRDHKVRKVYRAIVEGNVRDDMGVIDKDMARARSDFRKKTVVDMFSKDFRGAERSAVTRYKVLARSADKSLTYLELYPLTGRTHQIRVHLRSIRHPIIGDDLYGSLKGMGLAPRSMLHAYKLEFTLRKKEIAVTAEVPTDMQKIVEEKFTDYSDNSNTIKK